MTEEKINNLIQTIKDSAHDEEAAHGLEDALYEVFIDFVAKRDDELGKLARLVLTTKDIDFQRLRA